MDFVWVTKIIFDGAISAEKSIQMIAEKMQVNVGLHSVDDGLIKQ